MQRRNRIVKSARDTRSKTDGKQGPQLHIYYSRDEIHNMLGGSKQSYLPHVNGRVVCGCFRKDMNEHLPEQVHFEGTIRSEIVKYAQVLASQGTPIPIFIKQRVREWEYIGNYYCVSVIQCVEASPNSAAQSYIRGTLYLKPAQPAEHESEATLPAQVLPDVDAHAMEGRRRLITHLSYERNRSLARQKKRVVHQQIGQLVCEVCGYDFGTPDSVRSACCEVHHLRPLASVKHVVSVTLDDLAILCSNCHRIIHRIHPMPSVDELHSRLLQEKTNRG